MEEIIIRCLKVSADSPTGLIWQDKVSSYSPITVGEPAGSMSNRGYYNVSVKGKTFRAHRVVYFLTHGEWPDQVDHIDGNRGNNRPDNLRSVNNLLNGHNRLGGKGYYKKRDKYQAYITVCNERKWLGVFATEEEARAAHLEARQRDYLNVPAILWQQLGLIQ